MVSLQRTIRSVKVATAALTLFGTTAWAQSPDLGNITGNFQLDSQVYREDSAIGAPDFPERLGANAFVNLIYTRGKVEAGARYEMYYPSLQGYTRNTGSGIPYRYLRYRGGRFDVTAGTFYEQFGSGMSLRTYEEWGLGFDNSIDGVRLKGELVKGVHMTGLIGRQRNAFSNKIENLSEGLIRGADIEWSLNETFDSLGSKTQISVGGSFVSRYQANNDPIQIYPENVAAGSARLTLARGPFSFFTEYAYKINDPSAVNAIIYKPGNGILVQGSYSRKGLGVTLQAKRIDNMDFRSDRSAGSNNLTVNFLPPQTRQHTYRLATLYPWATQPLGEWGFQGEVQYHLKKGTVLGGPYGTNITFNFSRIHGLDKVDTVDPWEGYSASFFGMTDKVWFQDINLEITRKFNKKVKATLSLLHINYEEALFRNLTGFTTTEDVTADVQIIDVSYKLNRKNTLRWELQHSLTKQEFGSWAMALVEYQFAPKFWVAVFDEWNYGNAELEKRLHYFSGTVGYNYRTYRFQLGYGRQRAGVLCVGGVCRIVPAANGVTFGVSGTF